MPLRVERDDVRHSFLVTMTGVVTLDELARFVADQIDAGCWAFCVLYDATAADVRLEALDPPPLQTWRELAHERAPRAPVAFVVVDPQQRAVVERYVRAAMAENLFTATVFSDRRAAEAWLGILREAPGD